MDAKTITPIDISLELREQIDTALRQYVAFDEDCLAQLREAIEYSLLAPGK